MWRFCISDVQLSTCAFVEGPVCAPYASLAPIPPIAVFFPWVSVPHPWSQRYVVTALVWLCTLILMHAQQTVWVQGAGKGLETVQVHLASANSSL